MFRCILIVVIIKLGNPDYSISRLYNMICLLSTFLKIIKHAFLNRLIVCAYKCQSPLYFARQKKYPWLDAVHLLLETGRNTAQYIPYISTLFKDVMKGFDKVLYGCLTTIITAAVFLPSLVNCVQSDQSRLAILITNAVAWELTYTSVSVGIPHWSLLSHFLFNVYSQHVLHDEATDSMDFHMLCVDYFALVVTSRSCTLNSTALPNAGNELETYTINGGCNTISAKRTFLKPHTRTPILVKILLLLP